MNDNTLQYTVTFQGVCVDDETETSLVTEDYGDCNALITYTSSGACYIQYINITKYMDMIAPYTGALFILVGLVMCFYGSRFLPFMIAFLMGLLVGGFIGMVGYSFIDKAKVQLFHLIILLAVSVIFGIIAGICIFKVANNWAVTMLSFWLGIMVAVFILKLAQIQNQNITLIACGVGGMIGAYIGSKYNHGIKKLGTGVIGSFLLIRGLAMYIGHFPSEFETGDVDASVLNPDEGSQLFYTIGYLAAFIVIACLGFIFQKNYLQEEEDKDNVWADGDADEGKVCGCF